jgi:mevalonate kinase
MLKDTITYSAPGKVILSGEHTVLYGKCALISAVNKRILFSVSEGYQKKNESIDFVANIAKSYLQENKIPIVRTHYRIHIKSHIPRNRGLGSSGAFAVSGIAAFLEFYSGKDNFDLEVINNLAFKVEKRFHGNPSGVDQTTSCFGGLVFFRKEFEFLKGIYKLNFKIPRNIEKNLFLIDSGRPHENTAAMVKHVGDLYNKNSKKMKNLLNEMEIITKRVVVSIMKEDKKFFDENINESGDLLVELGIVSEQTQKLIKNLRKFGACKVTGAGGIVKNSGFVLMSVYDLAIFKKYCSNNNITAIKLVPSHTGLQRL